MEIVTRYRAEDGKEFPTEWACIAWENWLTDLAQGNADLASGATVWDALVRSHACLLRHPLTDCRYDWSYVCREHRPALRSITTHTALSIPHWQCKDTPGYTVNRICDDGQLWVSGDVGSWSGPYGAEVSVRDLCRYVKENGLIKKPDVA